MTNIVTEEMDTEMTNLATEEIYVDEFPCEAPPMEMQEKIGELLADNPELMSIFCDKLKLLS